MTSIDNINYHLENFVVLGKIIWVEFLWTELNNLKFRKLGYNLFLFLGFPIFNLKSINYKHWIYCPHPVLNLNRINNLALN